jgi:hypothetical protein
MYRKTAELIARRAPDLEIDQQSMLCVELTALQGRLDPDLDLNPEPIQMKQVGYLAGILDLEDEDRYEFVSALISMDVQYLGDIPGMEGLDCTPKYIGEPSTKDERITKYMASVLIDYFLEDPHGQQIIDLLGYERKSDHTKARVAQNRIARQAALQLKAAEQANRRTARLAAHQSKPTRKSKKSPDVVGVGI